MVGARVTAADVQVARIVARVAREQAVRSEVSRRVAGWRRRRAARRRTAQLLQLPGTAVLRAAGAVVWFLTSIACWRNR